MRFYIVSLAKVFLKISRSLLGTITFAIILEIRFLLPFRWQKCYSYNSITVVKITFAGIVYYLEN